MGEFSGLRRLLSGIPHCPMCDGPCTHELERSEWVFPDHLPEGDPGNRSADPKPEKAKKANLRGRRAHHGPAEDRAHKPAEDRS